MPLSSLISERLSFGRPKAFRLVGSSLDLDRALDVVPYALALQHDQTQRIHNVRPIREQLLVLAVTPLRPISESAKHSYRLIVPLYQGIVRLDDLIAI